MNIVKFSSGAPYIVALDDQQTGFDSFSEIASCMADFKKTGLQKKKHTIVVQHNGTSQLAAAGRSTLVVQNLVYSLLPPHIALSN